MRTRLRIASGVAVALLSAQVLAQAAATAPEARALASALLGRPLSDAEAQTPLSLWEAVERGDELLADWLRQDLKLSCGAELFSGPGGVTRFLQAVSTGRDGSPNRPPVPALCSRRLGEAHTPHVSRLMCSGPRWRMFGPT